MNKQMKGDGPWNIDKSHMMHIKSSGKPKIKSPYIQRNSVNKFLCCCQNTVKQGYTNLN